MAGFSVGEVREIDIRNFLEVALLGEQERAYQDQHKFELDSSSSTCANT
jgi:hypothetical protein